MDLPKLTKENLRQIPRAYQGAPSPDDLKTVSDVSTHSSIGPLDPDTGPQPTGLSLPGLSDGDRRRHAALGSYVTTHPFTSNDVVTELNKASNATTAKDFKAALSSAEGLIKDKDDEDDSNSATYDQPTVAERIGQYVKRAAPAVGTSAALTSVLGVLHLTHIILPGPLSYVAVAVIGAILGETGQASIKQAIRHFSPPRGLQPFPKQQQELEQEKKVQ